MHYRRRLGLRLGLTSAGVRPFGLPISDFAHYSAIVRLICNTIASAFMQRGQMKLNGLNLHVGLLLAAAMTYPAAALAQSRPAATNPAAQATLLGQYGDWGAYAASPGGQKVCFALSKPTASQDNPPNRRTAANVVYMFVSTRPGEKVKDEVSMLITGYAFKANTEATVTVGNANFAMYTQNDGAWVKNAAEENQLVESMRKGADAVIKATTSKGTRTTDTFSLKGISQALDRVAQECK
jgi:invasion protein IalB